MRRYGINEIFYSLQGEGIRAGTPNIFVRFAGCNQTCRQETHGFDCDTEFASSRLLTTKEITDAAKEISRGCRSMILTGGEPGLQLNDELIADLKTAGFYLAIETNGSVALPEQLDWITVSPKVAEHCIRQLTANEVKYVRHVGQGIPKPACKAEYKLLSPAASGDGIDQASLVWCIELVKQNPAWRLSCQQHKQWGIR